METTIPICNIGKRGQIFEIDKLMICSLICLGLGVKSSFDSCEHYGFSFSTYITYSHLSSWGRKKKKSRPHL